MTGPEHYLEAENRLRMAWEEGRDPENMRHLVSEAQVHATLALAAATALRPSQYAVGRPEFEQWRSAAAVEQRKENAS